MLRVNTFPKQQLRLLKTYPTHPCSKERDKWLHRMQASLCVAAEGRFFQNTEVFVLFVWLVDVCLVSAVSREYMETFGASLVPTSGLTFSVALQLIKSHRPGIKTTKLNF